MWIMYLHVLFHFKESYIYHKQNKLKQICADIIFFYCFSSVVIIHI